MKKALLLLGMIAAGAASGGVVAWSILSPAEKNGTHVVTPQSGAVSDDPFSQAGTHFTSYQASYPDGIGRRQQDEHGNYNFFHNK